MRIVLLALFFTSVPLSAETPRKKGGFFGFGSPPTDEISAGLFPEEPSRRARAAADSGDDGIFRGGQPQAVEPVSYTIKDGRRIEKPVPDPPTDSAASRDESVAALEAATVLGAEKKRGGLLGLGKKRSSSQLEHPGISPLPDPVLTATPVAAPAKPAKTSRTSKPSPSASGSAPLTPAPSAIPQAAPVETSALAEESGKKGRFGWIPFVGGKKDDEADRLPLAGPPVVARPVLAPSVATASAPPSKPSPTKRAPVKPILPKPAPAAESVAESVAGSAAESAGQPARASVAEKPSRPGEVATFEIRRDENQPIEKKKEDRPSRDGGLLPSIPRILPERTKEIDLTGAETIIQNGEIVGDSGSSFAITPSEPATGPRRAPQVVNGVKTYSSWNDVDARSTSAAEKILNQIR